MVDCNDFTPALWRLLLMSQTVVLGFLLSSHNFSIIKCFPWPTCSMFGSSVHQWFHIAQNIPKHDICAKAMVNFLTFKMACLSLLAGVLAFM